MQKLYGLWVIANIDHVKWLLNKCRYGGDGRRVEKWWKQHESECPICLEGKRILGLQIRNWAEGFALEDRITEEENVRAMGVGAGGGSR